MKHSIIFFVTSIILLFGSPLALLAQKTATWKGGTSGRPSEWNCAANWKEGRVPNEFSRVIIPDVSASTFRDPILTNGEVEIWSLEIHTGATLQIGRNARLKATAQADPEFTAWIGEGIIRSGMWPNTLVFAGK